MQRDIGSIVQYTLEMGGDIELVQLSLKAPPWEPMRVLSRDELRRTHLDLGLGGEGPVKPSVSKTAAGPSPVDRLRGTLHARGWMLDDRLEAGRRRGPTPSPSRVSGSAASMSPSAVRTRRGPTP